jgi:hypothetical protein
MKSLPDTFLVLNHEGLHKVTMSIDAVQSMDNLLARFGSEKLIVAKNLADHPWGMVHEAIWTSEPARFMTVLELTKGTMVLDTQYRGHTSKSPEQAWVSPCFVKAEGSFALRCAFDFGVWAGAGLRMFLALAHGQNVVYLWVYYLGQVYHVPFGNVFEGTEQVCLGQNTKGHHDIFLAPQSRTAALAKALNLLSISVWNHDTFQAGRNVPILASLVRFNSDPDRVDLPMMAPLEPDQIKKMPVATNRELVTVTAKLTQPIIQS